MFESRHRSTGNSANRWLIVAGAGLVILAFVARMLLDIGHTKVSDLAGALRPDTSSAQTMAPAAETPEPAVPAPPAPAIVDTPSAPPATSRVVNVTPPVLKRDTTTPRPAPPPKRAPTPAAAPGGGYAVQIGAFGSEANAAKLRDRASALGYSAAIVPQQRGASTLYLVRVQGLAGADQARQARDSLAHTLGVTSVVVPPGK